MKLYAVVIGRKDRHTRYVAYEPFSDGDNQNGRLAVYETFSRAKEAKAEIQKGGASPYVYIVGFFSRP